MEIRLGAAGDPPQSFSSSKPGSQPQLAAQVPLWSLYPPRGFFQEIWEEILWGQGCEGGTGAGGKGGASYLLEKIGATGLGGLS